MTIHDLLDRIREQADKRQFFNALSWHAELQTALVKGLRDAINGVRSEPNPGSGMGPTCARCGCEKSIHCFYGCQGNAAACSREAFVEPVDPPPASPCAECGGCGMEMIDGEPVGPCRECRTGGGRRTPPTPERKP